MNLPLFPLLFELNKRQSRRDTYEWTIQSHKQRWKQDTEQRQTKQTTLQVKLKDTQHGPHRKINSSWCKNYIIAYFIGFVLHAYIEFSKERFHWKKEVVKVRSHSRFLVSDRLLLHFLMIVCFTFVTDMHDIEYRTKRLMFYAMIYLKYW